MSLTQVTNLKYPQLIERMEKFMDVDTPLQGTFRCVLTRRNESWTLLMGVITLVESGLGHEVKSCCFQYPNFQFICESLSQTTLAKLMMKLNVDSEFTVGGLSNLGSKNENINWTESLIPSHASTSHFPERCFSGRIFNEVYSSDCKLVAHNLSFHPSAYGYMKEFLGLEIFHGSHDSRKGELLVRIPDRRGCLKLSAQGIGFDYGTWSSISVVGAVDGKHMNLTSPKDIYAVDLKKVSDVELWLVTEDNEIIDYCSSSEWEYRYGTSSGNTDLSKLLQIIAGGESEHCEFKQYIDLVDKKNSKAWEIEKAVCALSNHQGGKIFIGVDDEINIVGINDECQRDYKCPPDEGAKHYLNAVTKRLKESLVKNQCFNTYLIVHNQLFVLVIDVNKTKGLNYLLSKNEAFIRRGASSPKMTLAEIQALSGEQDVLGRDLEKY